MQRQILSEIAQETVEFVSAGRYTRANGQVVDLESMTRRCIELTRLDTSDATANPVLGSHPPQRLNTRIDVQNASALSLASRLAGEAEGRIAVLNLASARNPGGGFLRGSQAQEESLARSSALYASLTSEAAEPFYRHHGFVPSAMYSDLAIVSGDCPVFRDDHGHLLDTPYLATFITCAAPNAEALRANEPRELKRIPDVFERRIAKVLTLALDAGCPRLVLGAWGCGVFGNDPDMVAAQFAQHLGAGGAFHGRFESIDFAVLDRAAGEPTIAAFRRAFAQSCSPDVEIPVGKRKSSPKQR